MLSLSTGLTVIAGMVAASWAHEATHLLVARALGRVASANWLKLYVDYELRPGEPVRNRLIGLAPQLCGVTLAGVLTVLGAWPALSDGLVLYAALGTYTLLGGYSDYSQAAAGATGRMPDAVVLGYAHLDERRQSAVRWLLMALVSLGALGVLVSAAQAGQVSKFAYWALYPAVLAWFFVAISKADSYHPVVD